MTRRPRSMTSIPAMSRSDAPGPYSPAVWFKYRGVRYFLSFNNYRRVLAALGGSRTHQRILNDLNRLSLSKRYKSTARITVIPDLGKLSPIAARLALRAFNGRYGLTSRGSTLQP